MKTKLDLVTGGSGFFGTHLVRYLLSKRRKVRVLDIVEPDKSVKDKVEFVKGDIRNFNIVSNACKNVDTVYHTVAVVPISKSGKKFDQINAGGTKNTCKAALRNKVRAFVHLSSSAIYKIPKKGDIITENYPIMPVSDYGRAKWHAEKICMNYMKKGLNISIIRPRTILGIERLGLYSILFNWIHLGKKVYIFGKGDNLFSYISATDLAEACYLASKKRVLETFNIGTDEYGTYRGDLRKLIKHARSKSKIIPINATLCRVLSMILDKMGVSPLAEWHYRTVDKEYVFDCSKAKKILGWKAKDSNEKMLFESYDWFVKHYKEFKNQYGKKHRLPIKEGIIHLIKYFS